MNPLSSTAAISLITGLLILAKSSSIAADTTSFKIGNPHRIRQISAIGKVISGSAKGMRYRVRLKRQECSQNDKISLFESALLRRQKGRFLSQVKRLEMVPPKESLRIASLSSATSCHINSSRIIGLQVTFEEFVPYDNPRHLTRTASFRESDGSRIQLRDIFYAAYFEQALRFISDATRRDLQRKLDPSGEELALSEWIVQGTEPKEDNFNRFLLTSDGLRFIFEEYQVAPYGLGIQESTISWSEIAGMLSNYN